MSDDGSLFKIFHLDQSFGCSNRRAGGWIPIQDTVAGQVLIGLASVVLTGGILTVIIVSLAAATAKAKGESAKMTYPLKVECSFQGMFQDLIKTKLLLQGCQRV